jgi:F0F1-type ATP synthase membrane subunit a
MEAAVDFVTDIAKDQLGESFYKEWIYWNIILLCFRM